MTTQCTITALSAAQYTNGWTLWHYRSADASIAAIYDRGYWAPAAAALRDGDTVIVDHPKSREQVTCRVCQHDGELPSVKPQMAY